MKSLLPPLPQLKKLKVAKLRLKKPLTIRGIMSAVASHQLGKVKQF